VCVSMVHILFFFFDYYYHFICPLNPRCTQPQTRYVTKYMHKEGQFVLKVTDDVTCLTFRTQNHHDLANIQGLSGVFMRLMTCGDMQAELTLMEDEQKQVEAKEEERRSKAQQKQNKKRRKN
jgi:hypothetical protein